MYAFKTKGNTLSMVEAKGKYTINKSEMYYKRWTKRFDYHALQNDKWLKQKVNNLEGTVADIIKRNI